jgi:hypothetical protein
MTELQRIWVSTDILWHVDPLLGNGHNRHARNNRRAEECHLWDVALCRSWVNRRFGGTYRLHLQGRKIRERGTSMSRILTYVKTTHAWTRAVALHLSFFKSSSNNWSFLSFQNLKDCSSNPVCSHLLTLVPHSRIFLPWRWRRYVPPKRRFTQDLQGTTSQKMALFIVTAWKPQILNRRAVGSHVRVVRADAI